VREENGMHMLEEVTNQAEEQKYTKLHPTPKTLQNNTQKLPNCA
jgi:hypothetical protein